MVAVKVTGEQRAAIVAAPAYFDSHPKPKTPRDLTVHRCISHRIGPRGPVYRWEFEKRGKPVTVSVSGPFIFSDSTFTLRAALDGLGLAFLFEEHVGRTRGARQAGAGARRLVPVVRRLLLVLSKPTSSAAGAQALVNALRL
jgi:DNA-binding transcriptional LysR family regulator